MQRKTEEKLLNEILKLKEDKSVLINHEEAINNLIAHLLFLKYQSEAFYKEQKLFIAKMNHELKTPLNAILGFAQIMEDEIQNEKHKKYIQHILSSGRMILSLIDNMLDFSKSEMNDLKINESKVELLTILNETILLIQKAFPLEKRKIKIHFSSLIYLRFDERMLKQIFLNILSNSVKFTHSDGSIDIYFEKLSTGIRLIFKDNGYGIEKEKLIHIFDPFYQMPSSIGKYQQGMGLGLVLVKKMVILHQGRVDIKSVLNQGTSLIIDFPQERIILPGDDDESI